MIAKLYSMSTDDVSMDDIDPIYSSTTPNDGHSLVFSDNISEAWKDTEKHLRSMKGLIEPLTT